MPDPELEAFKTDINLTEYAASCGYQFIRHESSRNSVVMKHPGTGDKIIIARNQANNHWIFFTRKNARKPRPQPRSGRVGMNRSR